MTTIDWPAVSAELATNRETRQLAGNITRATLISWRTTRAFPPPVLVIATGGNDVELWSRSQVRAWLRASDPRKTRRPRGQHPPALPKDLLA
jgi:hypothetical protein